MAERKAVNKYYPPDWDPRKGSANKRVGQHPLRDRARKLSQGILVIRFELPYNIWCGGCGNHVGMGVRYNAEKSKVGNYYSTPIYKFRMKCHLCDNYFEIQTDPKNHDYVILSGARRKEQRWDPVANEQVVPEDKATQKKLATDPMYKLEHGSDDQQKGKEKVMSLAQIEESRMCMLDDYILNRMARDKFREEKKQLKEAADADKAIVERASLSIDLVEESEEDKRLARLMKYSVTSSFEEKQKDRRKSIEQRPIFSTGNSLSPASMNVSSPLISSYAASSSHLISTAHGHGDLKNKLGRVLQATYSDPFKVERKTDEKINSVSTTHRSKLGIKLKHSKDGRLKSALVTPKKNGTKVDAVVKTLQQEVNTPKMVCSLELRNTYNVSSSGSLTPEVASAEINFKSESDSAMCNASSMQVKTPLSPGRGLNIPAADKQDTNKELKNVSPQSSDDQESNVINQTKETNIYVASPSGICQLSPSISPDNLSTNNTGLLALMSNYMDSDGE